ncbi:HalOD1 output domain-containing protein [Natronobacterium lacisalsi]|nr:HalOD1 output domain-containing protein [Halobiforma lacisalsi]
MRNGESPSITVVRAIAIREGVDPVELDPPLHEVVDSSPSTVCPRRTAARATTLRSSLRTTPTGFA